MAFVSHHEGLLLNLLVAYLGRSAQRVLEK